jgi:cytochrome c-type biogenesis protein CcmF
VFLLLSLAAVVMFGTLIDPVSKALGGRSVQVGTTFYNQVLAPVGLGLLAVTAAVPLLQWGGPPTGKRRRLLTLCLAISLGIAALVAALGLRQPIAVVVAGMAALSATTLPAAGWYEVWRRESGGRWQTLLTSLRDGRRKYAAYSIHLGFVAVAIGVAGSSLGTDRREITMDEGSAYQWGEWHIRHVRLEQRELPDKLVAEAVLEVRRGDAEPAELRPARHFHLLQREWTTEAAIHSTWRGDFYTVLHAGLGEGRVALTLVNNPLMRWIWVGGMLSAVSAGVSLLPERRRRRAAAPLCEAAASRTARSTVKNRSAA